MPRKRQVPQFGSVSSGTMRPEDLLSAFEYECRTYGGRTGRKLACEYDRLTEEQVRGEEGMYLLEEMFDLLNEVAPAYGYFGAHPGDGADYGWWLSEDFENDFDGLKVSDLSEVPVSYRGEILLVNDHGNMTLYVKRGVRTTRERFQEIWSLV